MASVVPRLKQEPSDGYLLAHGGARFARSLVETGLIDEFRLVIHPVVLCAGPELPEAIMHLACTFICQRSLRAL
jgi:riboflavin biosynthesis pyrimidine reductase